MLKFSVFTGSFAFWLVMMALLFQREIIPFLEYEAPPTYKTFLRDKRNSEKIRMGVYLSGKRIGTAETRIWVKGDDGYLLQHRFDIDSSEALSELLSGQELPRTTLLASTVLDSACQLQRFELKTDIMGMRIWAKGWREGDQLVVKTSFTKDLMRVGLPKELMLLDESMPFWGRNLVVGKKWKVQVPKIDLLKGFQVTSLWVSVESKEPRYWQDKEVLAYQIEVRKDPKDRHPMQTLVVLEDGTVLQQQFWIGKLYFLLMLDEKSKLTEQAERGLLEGWEAVR